MVTRQERTDIAKARYHIRFLFATREDEAAGGTAKEGLARGDVGPLRCRSGVSSIHKGPSVRRYRAYRLALAVTLTGSGKEKAFSTWPGDFQNRRSCSGQSKRFVR